MLRLPDDGNSAAADLLHESELTDVCPRDKRSRWARKDRAQIGVFGEELFERLSDVLWLLGDEVALARARVSPRQFEPRVESALRSVVDVGSAPWRH